MVLLYNTSTPVDHLSTSGEILEKVKEGNHIILSIARCRVFALLRNTHTV